MIFQGFEVTPLGNAELNIDNGILKVSNIGSSGLDGVMVNVNGSNNYGIGLNAMPVFASGEFLKTSRIAKNSLNQSVVVAEEFKWLDVLTDRIQFGYNAFLLPSQFQTVGLLNGETVFEYDETLNLNESRYSDEVETNVRGFWVPLVLAVLAVAAIANKVAETKATKVFTRTVKLYDENGKYWGKRDHLCQDPVPFEVVVHGNTHLVDTVGIQYQSMIPTPLPEDTSIYDLNNVGAQIVGRNLGMFEINSIENYDI